MQRNGKSINSIVIQLQKLESPQSKANEQLLSELINMVRDLMDTGGGYDPDLTTADEDIAWRLKNLLRSAYVRIERDPAMQAKTPAQEFEKVLKAIAEEVFQDEPDFFKDADAEVEAKSLAAREKLSPSEQAISAAEGLKDSVMKQDLFFKELELPIKIHEEEIKKEMNEFNELIPDRHQPSALYIQVGDLRRKVSAFDQESDPKNKEIFAEFLKEFKEICAGRAELTMQNKEIAKEILEVMNKYYRDKRVTGASPSAGLFRKASGKISAFFIASEENQGAFKSPFKEMLLTEAIRAFKPYLNSGLPGKYKKMSDVVKDAGHNIDREIEAEKKLKGIDYKG